MTEPHSLTRTSRSSADTARMGWTAMEVWSLAYRYGNLPLARSAVESLKRLGWPHSGMVELVERNWRGVSAAQTGWAAHPEGVTQPLTQ